MMKSPSKNSSFAQSKIGLFIGLGGGWACVGTQVCVGAQPWVPTQVPKSDFFSVLWIFLPYFDPLCVWTHTCMWAQEIWFYFFMFSRDHLPKPSLTCVWAQVPWSSGFRKFFPQLHDTVIYSEYIRIFFLILFWRLIFENIWIWILKLFRLINHRKLIIISSIFY